MFVEILINVVFTRLFDENLLREKEKKLLLFKIVTGDFLKIVLIALLSKKF